MRTLRLVLAASIASCCGVWIACSSSSTPPPASGGDSGAGSDAGGDSGSLFTLAVPCTDTQDAVYGDPGTLPADKGDIIKCFVDSDISMSDLQSKLVANVSTDPAPVQN